MNDVINIDSLDFTISRKVDEMLKIGLLNEYGVYDVTFDEFVTLMDKNLRGKIEGLIKEYYSSMGDVEISINDAEYYESVVEAVKQMA